MQKIVFFFLLIFFLFVTPTYALFSDIQNHWYRDAIQLLYEKSVVQGYQDGTFRPDFNVNRAEFLKMVMLLQHKDFNASNCFSDVKSSDWFSPYVCKAKNEKIVEGYSNGLFRPAQNITLVEAIIIVERAFNISFSSTGSEWYEGPIRKASEMNIIPLDIGYFDAPLSRSQSADMLARFIYFQNGNLDSYLKENSNIRHTFEDIVSHNPKGCVFRNPDCSIDASCTNNRCVVRNEVKNDTIVLEPNFSYSEKGLSESASNPVPLEEPVLNSIITPPIPQEVKVLVVPVTSSVPTHEEISINQISNIFFDLSDENSVASFYKRNSYNALSIIGNVQHELLPANFKITYSDAGKKTNAGTQILVDLLATSIDLNEYNYYFFIIFEDSPCIGFTTASYYGDEESQKLIRFAVVTSACVNNNQSKSTIGHEFGHLLGLSHSGGWIPEGDPSCGLDVPLSTIANEACYSSYDSVSVIGTGTGDLYTFHRNKLAFPFQAPYIDTQTSGDYWLHWFRNNSEMKYVEEIRIPANNGYYSLEFLKNIKQATPEGSIEESGVMVNFVPNSNSFWVSTRLLDFLNVTRPSEMLKETNDTFVDITRGISISIKGISDNSAYIHISRDSK